MIIGCALQITFCAANPFQSIPGQRPLGGIPEYLRLYFLHSLQLAGRNLMGHGESVGVDNQDMGKKKREREEREK